jgi:hypothetical protein
MHAQKISDNARERIDAMRDRSERPDAQELAKPAEMTTKAATS